MANFLQTLSSTALTVLVNTKLQAGGFAITYSGSLGKTIVTSPLVTQQLLNSPEFDQLFQDAKATRILDIVFMQTHT